MLYDFADFFLARLACTPVSALGPFGDASLPLLARDAAEEHHRFESIASEACACVSTYVCPAADRATRRKISKLKRARKSPSRFLAMTVTLPDIHLLGRGKDLIDGARAAAVECISATDAFEAEYSRQVEREREGLRAALAEPDFQHGVRYSSNGIRYQLDRYEGGNGRWKPGRLRKLEETLAAYLGRAVAKTSPFSTFTATAWGHWSTQPIDRVEIGPPSERMRRSWVRLNRAALDCILTDLLTTPHLHDDLIVRANPTVVARGGVLSLYRARPMREKAAMQYIPVSEDLVRVPLSPALASILEALHAAGGRSSIADLCGRAERRKRISETLHRAPDRPSRLRNSSSSAGA